MYTLFGIKETIYNNYNLYKVLWILPQLLWYCKGLILLLMHESGICDLHQRLSRSQELKVTCTIQQYKLSFIYTNTQLNSLCQNIHWQICYFFFNTKLKIFSAVCLVTRWITQHSPDSTSTETRTEFNVQDKLILIGKAQVF